MKRTVLVVGMYPSESCPIFTLNLANALHDAGYDVTALVPDTVTNREAWENQDNIRVIYLKLAGSGWNRIKVLKLLGSIEFIINHRVKTRWAERMLNRRFDLVFYTFYHPLNSFIDLGIRASRRYLFVHDPLTHSGEHDRLQKRQIAQARSMDGVVVMTRGFVQLVEEMYDIPKNKIYHMEHPLLTGITGQHKQTMQQRANFLFFGRIEEYKGIDVLLSAYGLLCQEDRKEDSFSLTVAGKGDFSKYESAYSGLRRTRLMNRYITDDEIANLFSTEDCVLVVPYRDATQSGVIALAYSYGVPVIASATGGLSEQLNDGKIGLFVSPGDSNSLCKMMKYALDNPAVRIEQGLLMLEKANDLTWENCVRRLLVQIETLNLQ